jgi:MFS family permease
MTAPAPSVSIRSIIALGAASFMSSATIRVGDPLIPQIADDFGVGIAAAAIVSTAFALAYGVCQLIHGPLGDRFGKLRMIVLATALSGFGTASVAWADRGRRAALPQRRHCLGDHSAFHGAYRRRGSL